MRFLSPHRPSLPFQDPPHLRFKVSNNILECLAEIMAMWLGIIEGELVEHSCAFSVTDNTSAIGWTHKSNFCDSAKKPHLMFGRKLAELTINSKIYLHIQHIKGWLNVIADSLSRDSYLSDFVLTKNLSYFYPNYLLRSFRIFPLSSEIT